MNYQKIKGVGCDIHIINNNKFHTTECRIYFTENVNKELITYRNALISVLTYATNTYNTKEKLIKRCQDLYSLVPVFGQNCIWLIGSCNYLWTMTFMLLFIYQYTFRSDEKNTILRIIIFFLFGIIVGWTNENTAVGLIIIVILLIKWIIRSNYRICIYDISSRK